MHGKSRWIFGLCCFAVLVIALAVWLLRPRHLALGILVPVELLQETTKDHTYPDLSAPAGEFEGPTTLWIGENRIELPRARVVYFLDAGYPTSYFALERTGQYDSAALIDRWTALLSMARALPEWRQADSVVPDPTDREAAKTMLDLMAPGGRLANARKLGLLSGRFRQEVNGRPFFTRLDVNVTYDASRPETPYRLAFEQGIHARSLKCLSHQIDDMIAARRDGTSEPDNTDPVLSNVFGDWDGQENTLRAFIDTYIFDRCTLNANEWSEL